MYIHNDIKKLNRQFKNVNRFDYYCLYYIIVKSIIMSK